MPVYRIFMHRYPRTAIRTISKFTGKLSTDSTAAAAMIGSLKGEGKAEWTVGIRAYVNELAGFTGIVKQRYTDFVVREVSQGSPVYLKDIDGFDCEALFENQGTGAAVPAAGAAEGDEGATDQIGLFLSELAAICPEALWKLPATEVQQYLQSLCSREPNAAPRMILVPCAVKELRTSIHMLISKRLSSIVDSTTDSNEEGTACIVLIAKQKQKSSQKRRRNDWPKDVGDYLEFTLMKENCDTIEACNYITKQMHWQPGTIAIAGTKDKRAVTTQRCTVYKKRPSNLLPINRMKYPILRVGDFRYVHKPLTLGDAAGNQFEIVLRDIKEAVVVIEAACESVKSRGFINYFGLQRFGKGGSKSHEVGRAIYLGQWKSAVDMLFTLREGDRPEIAQAKALYQEGKLGEALRTMPHKMYSEKLVLQYLLRKPNDFAGAYQSVARGNRLICAHAYQSYVWNMAATERIRLFGLHCVEGDIVVVDKLLAAALEQDAALAIGDDVGDDNGDRADDPPTEKVDEATLTADNSNQAAAAVLPPLALPSHHKGGRFTGLHVVTKEDVDAGRYSMSDVLLPLVGFESILPEHSVKDFIVELLAHEGLTINSFKSCQHQYQMPGSYRKVMQYVKDFQWEHAMCESIHDEIVHTELDNFRNHAQAKRPAAASHAAPIPPVDIAEMDEATVGTEVGTMEATAVQVASDGIHLAGPANLVRCLKLKFVLAPGSYATMLLRELTKESTETQYHSNLTRQLENQETNRQQAEAEA